LIFNFEKHSNKNSTQSNGVEVDDMNTLETNKQLVRDLLVAICNADKDALEKLIADDVVYNVPGSCFISGDYNKQEFIAGAELVNTLLGGSLQFDIQSLTAEDDRVCCVAQGSAKTITGESYNNFYNLTFFIRDKQVYKAHEFMDTCLVENVLKPVCG
jgi:uncharacterized protein